MVLAARERLARVLGGQGTPTASSARMDAAIEDLCLDVEGIGRISLPVPARQARRLCRLSRPARFGRGEQTLTDASVRDTWEVPKNLVRAEWRDGLTGMLAALRYELGLPPRCELTAELHSMLVYEAGQFFVPHQDSEKDDSMVGTLVVTLPSNHAGGELVIRHGGAATTYDGPQSSVSLVAFYADCLHEVRPVKSGYRITLTYNLLLHGDTSEPATGGDAAVAELARSLGEHFATRITNRYTDAESDPPRRLVYLLDHEYTARGLSFARLKGVDAGRAALLRAAADQAGCEVALALAEVQEKWNAYDPEPRYYREDWDWDSDSGWEDEYRGGDIELQDLIDSYVRLTRWTGPAVGKAADISLTAGAAEICTSTPSADLTPYESEYEGYMGNYGNTIDRWYRRAALVVWPRELAFANRAEAAPEWALDALSARARGGDPAGARAAAASLAPFWDMIVRRRKGPQLLGAAVRTALAVGDAEAADLLVRPFRIEDLGAAEVPVLAELAGQHGEKWTGELLRVWFDEPRTWTYAGDRDRPEFLRTLPVLCEALLAVGGSGPLVAHEVLKLSWDWLGARLRQELATQAPSYRDEQLADLGEPLAALLTAAAIASFSGLPGEVASFADGAGDAVLACLLPALRASGSLPAERRRRGGFEQLATRSVDWLRARLTVPARADDDWSLELPDGCTCSLCGSLREFLASRSRRVLEWPIAKERRHHVHSRIDAAELPVRHLTRRQGRPYTLVLTKSEALFERERQARERDEAYLEWLTGEYP